MNENIKTVKAPIEDLQSFVKDIKKKYNAYFEITDSLYCYDGDHIAPCIRILRNIDKAKADYPDIWKDSEIRNLFDQTLKHLMYLRCKEAEENHPNWDNNLIETKTLSSICPNINSQGSNE